MRAIEALPRSSCTTHSTHGLSSGPELFRFAHCLGKANRYTWHCLSGGATCLKRSSKSTNLSLILWLGPDRAAVAGRLTGYRCGCLPNITIEFKRECFTHSFLACRLPPRSNVGRETVATRVRYGRVPWGRRPPNFTLPFASSAPFTVWQAASCESTPIAN